MASTATSEIELTSPRQHSEQVQDEVDGREMNALAPADGGLQAWLFLAGCVMIESLVWGFVFAFGVFENYYSSTVFKGQQVASIGTTAAGILYLSTPFVFAALFYLPNMRRACLWAGLVIMCTGLVAASFMTTTRGLIATQGVLYAIGASAVYDPTFLFVDEWFVRRKGMAFGIMWAGTGMGGIVLPLIFQALLQRWGYPTVLRAYAIALLILLGPVLPFIRPRLPSAPVRKLDLSFLPSPSFLILQSGNVLEGIGYFLPTIFLPSFAASLGASDTLATLSVVFVNVASVVGCVIMGLMIDRLHVTTCQAICTVGSTVSVFLIWGLSNNLGQLYAFCFLYGLFAGSYSTTWTGVSKLVCGKVARAQPMFIFAFLVLGRGLGNIVSGPLSSTLLSATSWAGQANFGYGTRYGPLIVFTGISMMLGGVSMLGRLKKGLLTLN